MPATYLNFVYKVKDTHCFACKIDPTFQHISARLLCTSNLVNHCTQIKNLNLLALHLEEGIKKMDYTLHKVASNQIEQIQVPMSS